MFDVVVIGNVGIDTNIYLPDADIDFNVEANFSENMDYVGQAGGYAARGFAQLGYKTAFIGYVGDDYHGDFIRKEFKADGINIDAVMIDPAGSSRSINFMYRDGRRKNFYDGKSHMKLQPDMMQIRPILAQSKLIHYNIPNWARLLLPVSSELNQIISCDIQDVVHIDDPYRRDFIRSANVLFFSATNYSDPQHIIEQLLKQYPHKIIICGMGAQGCAVGIHSEVKHYPTVNLPDPVVDTNGAGDGLAVGFLCAYYLQGLGLERSIQCGQIVARYTCTQKASTSRLISRDQLQHWLNNPL